MTRNQSPSSARSRTGPRWEQKAQSTVFNILLGDIKLIVVSPVSFHSYGRVITYSALYSSGITELDKAIATQKKDELFYFIYVIFHI